MNVQESEEFKTSKFFCKTDFDMKEIRRRKRRMYRYRSSTRSSRGRNGNAFFIGIS